MEEEIAPGNQRPAVLVIDDDSIVRSVVQTALKFAGYRVFEAADGREGIDLIQRHRQELAVIFLDIVMPVLNGIAVLQFLKDSRIEVPVLISSGYGQGQLLRETEGLPFFGFIQKPFTIQALINAINEASGK